MATRRPFTWDLHIPDEQIASDLKSLSQTTACDPHLLGKRRARQGAKARCRYGPQGAARHLAWAESLPTIAARSRQALTLARRYPATVEALIVGNEVLLRGELPAARIKAYLEEVKRRSGFRSPMPMYGSSG
jgi:glucan 1,3-beta-glucosidase